MQVDWLKSIVLQSVGMTHAPLRFEYLLLLFNPRRDKPNKVTRRHKGVSIGPLPSIFDTIHLIHLIFGTNHDFLCIFQLIETMWCLIGIHGNHHHINGIASDRHFRFSNFQIFFHIRIEH